MCKVSLSPRRVHVIVLLLPRCLASRLLTLARVCLSVRVSMCVYVCLCLWQDCFIKPVAKAIHTLLCQNRASKVVFGRPQCSLLCHFYSYTQAHDSCAHPSSYTTTPSLPARSPTQQLPLTLSIVS